MNPVKTRPRQNFESVCEFQEGGGVESDSSLKPSEEKCTQSLRSSPLLLHFCQSAENAIIALWSPSSLCMLEYYYYYTLLSPPFLPFLTATVKTSLKNSDVVRGEI